MPKTLCCISLGMLMAFTLSAQVRVVNVVPKSQSDESRQDAEPSLSVDPENPKTIVLSAFINPVTVCGIAAGSAPLAVSFDAGMSWLYTCIIPSNGTGLGTSDITVGFSPTGSTLFAGILRNASPVPLLNILRGSALLGPSLMEVLHQRAAVDQPFITVGGGGNAMIANNDLSEPNGRTATVDWVYGAGGANPRVTSHRLESRMTAGQDGPPVRVASHADGTVLAAFMRWNLWTGTMAVADIVVTRDRTGGLGTPAFDDLREPGAPHGDGLPGVIVAKDVEIPWGGGVLGQERVGADISIAVDPRSSDTVFLAWADKGTAGYDLHVRRSADGGRTWSGDLARVPRAKNPALAVSSAGVVGLLYQGLETDGKIQRWRTAVLTTTDAFRTARRWELALTPADTPLAQYWPYLGDYASLTSVGDAFYGAFSASNAPDSTNFPSGVQYQRNVDFANRRLLGVDGVTRVEPSIDPFFFTIRP